MAAARREIILASGSAIRRQLLEAAGVQFLVQPADVDERAIQMSYDGLDPAGVAVKLARAKAEAVSLGHPKALVIGADQVLARGTSIFNKPADMAQAREHLRRLQGQTHHLYSAIAVALGGSVIWDRCDTAQMTMRTFSDGFLDDYLLRAGERICDCVGAYEYERLGLQLFERIEGDYFTILGLPMMPLLAELRARGGIPS